MTTFKTTLTGAAAALALSASAALAQNVVTVNVVQIFGTIDPAKINDYTEYMAGVNLYEGLTTVDGDGAIQPLLAESWEVSEDLLTWTFTLKEGATFQDGSPVEAKDVVWSIERLVALNQGPAYLFADVLDAGAVTAVDDRTVQITLNRVYSPFLTTTPILFVVNSDLAQENATEDDPWAEDFIANNSAGAGAFMLDSWERGAAMTLKAYEGYHLGWDDQSIDEVRFVVTNEEATVRALAASGELSLSSDAQAQETYDAIGAMENYRIEVYPTADNFYFKLNNQRPPTDDVLIRRALALATDYETIREVLLPGEPLAGPMPPVFADAFPEDVALPVFDLEAAAELVRQSSYADQVPIDIEMMYVAGLAFEEEIALLQKSILDSIGFNVLLRPEPWNRMTELASDVEQTPAMNQVFYGATYPSPDSYFFPQYHSRAAGTWASMEWVLDPEVDAMIDAARATADVEEQNEIYKALQRKLVEDQVAVFLLTQRGQQAMHECLQNFVYVPMQSFEFNFHTMKWVCD
ncbi:ABC transporter substrate-binding protein [Histidinibacterium lentulum]|uniref:ABC transporter substrate-binding protein n=1 Tax=Histidinibacterium lentulum TaxID=2480588 RepID=A0A3N2RAG4_9RHOB|nr:ABC transporter substrate-binding protein [Histidinibacterium lentulum]ROU04405.1 ABC transporter substrate-binding protein [Histidinibacterium lentulum]